MLWEEAGEGGRASVRQSALNFHLTFKGSALLLRDAL